MAVRRGGNSRQWMVPLNYARSVAFHASNRMILFLLPILFQSRDFDLSPVGAEIQFYFLFIAGRNVQLVYLNTVYEMDAENLSNHRNSLDIQQRCRPSINNFHIKCSWRSFTAYLRNINLTLSAVERKLCFFRISFGTRVISYCPVMSYFSKLVSQI